MKIIQKNDDIYNNTKAVISGTVDQINDTVNDTTKNISKSIKDIFNIDTTEIKIFGLLFLTFLLLKK